MVAISKVDSDPLFSDHPQHRSRGRRVRPECCTPTRRFCPGGRAVVRIPQDASRLGRRISVLRPSQRLAAHPSRDDLEGREPGRSNGAKRRGHHAGGRAVNDRLDMEPTLVSAEHEVTRLRMRLLGHFGVGHQQMYHTAMEYTPMERSTLTRVFLCFLVLFSISIYFTFL